MIFLPRPWAVRKPRWPNHEGWQIVENGTVLDSRPSAASACKRVHQIIEQRRRRRIGALAGVYR